VGVVESVGGGACDLCIEGDDFERRGLIGWGKRKEDEDQFSELTLWR
jgi:hypothetical protein